MKTFFIKLHRILGSVLSLVFLMWFLSGFVMIFARFPKPDKKQAFEKSEMLKSYISEIKIPEGLVSTDITLEVVNGLPIYTSKSSSFYSPKPVTINARSLKPVLNFPERKLDSMVKARYQSNIAKKTILTDFDAWIPWSGFRDFFPIHKYFLDDDAKTEVYVASTTGKVVQESTRKQRWLARFGAIPHWFYYKSLRLHQGLWADFIIWLSGIGAVLCLSGLIVGVYRSRKWKRLKKKGLLHFSPYGKKWYKWHHMVGMIFGVFAFSAVFSGMLSLQDIPQWLLPLKEKPDYQKIWDETVTDYSSFNLPLSKVLEDERFSDTKQIQWQKIGEKPYYFLYQNEGSPTIVKADQTDSVGLKVFDYNDLKQLIAKKFNTQIYSISHLKTTDYYFNPKKRVVAKVVFNDNNKTWGYIAADNPTKLYTNHKSKRISRWLYDGLHTLSFPGLSEVDWLRKTLLFIICILGTIISSTGVVLTYQYLTRLKKKWKKKK